MSTEINNKFIGYLNSRMR
jgi:hypothetical protein